MHPLFGRSGYGQTAASVLLVAQLGFTPALLAQEQAPPAAAPEAPPAGPAQPAETPPAATPAVPDTPPAEPQQAPTEPAAPAEPQVLVAEVRVVASKGKLGDTLEGRVYNAIRTRPGQTTTRTQLQQDINAVFATGYFADVKATPEDTPLGVRVTFDVSPNPTLEAVSTEGSTLLPEAVVQETFKNQVGQTLNFGELQRGVKSLEEWYAERGYVLAKVADVQSTPDGKVKLTVTEGIIEDIRVKGNTRTRDFIVTREVALKPGGVFNRNAIQRDLQRVYALNIFKDVGLDLGQGQDPQKVVVNIKVEEKSTGSIAAGAGVNSAYGFFGTLSLQESNLGGNNQKIGLDVQGGGQILLFNLSFTDPWIAGDPNRTSLSTNIFNRQAFSYVFNGGGVGVLNPRTGFVETPRENRLGLGVIFGRPLNNEWRASAGARFETVQLRDFLGRRYTTDNLGNPLTISGTDTDRLFFLQGALVRDTRDNPNTPRSGSVLRGSLDQSVGVLGDVFFTRPTVSYSQFIPMDILPWGQGKQVLAFNSSVGTVFGALPPYEAFTLGGGNSVRGFFEGNLGTGRSYMINSVEFRAPVFDPVGAALFVDYGTTLGSQAAVLGAPAIVRGKIGAGLGFGIGLRVQSPLGPLRIDFAANTAGLPSQVHFGLGEKF
ncbi:BamA/TamA family outer membrane protein [Gloeobacter violaceus]|uniref:Glr1863 protein n=1 Tax=Gloeobacter violaceus (strain ATCC 29082 / PCC 7421) TaxID=251221 RepID=Q7NJG9_GLOVI|nr:BamA/TamA family outer membrane protein [Gloeobacter violaceus]BAC89804.1 glr1863 [Gloeobacter violaceus PCC 7421]